VNPRYLKSRDALIDTLLINFGRVIQAGSPLFLALFVAKHTTKVLAGMLLQDNHDIKVTSYVTLPSCCNNLGIVNLATSCDFLHAKRLVPQRDHQPFFVPVARKRITWISMPSAGPAVVDIHHAYPKARLIKPLMTKRARRTIDFVRARRDNDSSRLGVSKCPVLPRR